MHPSYHSMPCNLYRANLYTESPSRRSFMLLVCLDHYIYGIQVMPVGFQDFPCTPRIILCYVICLGQSVHGVTVTTFVHASCPFIRPHPGETRLSMGRVHLRTGRRRGMGRGGAKRGGGRVRVIRMGVWLG
jgi:hypothetical protein